MMDSLIWRHFNNTQWIQIDHRSICLCMSSQMTSKTSTATTIAFEKINSKHQQDPKLSQDAIHLNSSLSSFYRLKLQPWKVDSRKGSAPFLGFSIQDPGNDLAFQKCCRLWPRGICLRTAVMIGYMDANCTVMMCFWFVCVFICACFWLGLYLSCCRTHRKSFRYAKNKTRLTQNFLAHCEAEASVNVVNFMP